MSSMIKNVFFGLVVVGIIFSFGTGLVLADEHPIVPELTEEQIFEKIGIITDWIFTALVITAVFIILIAAFQFVTGGPEGIIAARQKLIWAVVGIVLALLAKGIPALIINVLNPQE